MVMMMMMMKMSCVCISDYGALKLAARHRGQLLSSTTTTASDEALTPASQALNPFPRQSMDDARR